MDNTLIQTKLNSPRISRDLVERPHLVQRLNQHIDRKLTLVSAPAASIHDGLIFLLAHMPPCLHLVITSRADPPFPLSRWRVRGQMTEIRDADLRFTEPETAVFLNQIMHLNLSAADVAALETRTEGWVASLKLAALAMQTPTAYPRFGCHWTGHRGPASAAVGNGRYPSPGRN